MRSPPHSRKERQPVSGWVATRESWTPKPPAPELPAPYDDRDIRAWQALNLGQATPDQQRRCLEHLIYISDPTGALGYVPGDPYASAYENGKRRVGIEISNIIARRPSAAADTEQGV
jgi:hypothetical protein